MAVEAQVMDGVEEIAYNNAVLDDALEAQLLDIKVLCHEVPFLGEAYAQVDAGHPAAREKLKFNEALKRLLDQLATDLINTTNSLLTDSGVRTIDDIRGAGIRLPRFSEKRGAQNAQLKRFLYTHVYDRPEITEDRDRSVQCLEKPFAYYLRSPGTLPASY